MAQATETVLVIGATGNIGIAAILGALRSGRNVLAVVRNQDSAKKLFEHLHEGQDSITVVEADVISDHGVQGVVEKVRAGSLPAFQHVFSSVGGGYTEKTMLEATTAELREFMTHNFESNFFAYRATIPYLLEQRSQPCTWTTCTGSQGDKGDRALPAISQGAMFSMAFSACKSLADTNVRFNEIYLAQRVEVDVVAEQHGTMRSSVFGRVYANILAKTDVKGCRVRVESEKDVDHLRTENKA
ncbi:short-chain dehydrogenase [Colletotrichum tofieldiae]|uniref:Short-chain dehydrogenase n=1 Tax=Colletotrichum tofieldiae TaxID=708197 RepID=A0A166VVV7_9PEZI|nr:short-chain dehydrogenase [Colletotrichum tofieldiae]GKT66852.1 short-chain dehydrogenase [Colletotrichum tofieldiae]GKT80534.1 short-chain dehydrogenase [Colletotrichum tofieldiae]GKT94892.1 short-chain dehydrogenase [Colletotrichum tofieldiae]